MHQHQYTEYTQSRQIPSRKTNNCCFGCYQTTATTTVFKQCECANADNHILITITNPFFGSIGKNVLYNVCSKNDLITDTDVTIVFPSKKFIEGNMKFPASYRHAKTNEHIPDENIPLIARNFALHIINKVLETASGMNEVEFGIVCCRECNTELVKMKKVVTETSYLCGLYSDVNVEIVQMSNRHELNMSDAITMPKPWNGITVGSNLETKFIHTKKNEVIIVITDRPNIYNKHEPQYYTDDSYLLIK